MGATEYLLIFGATFVAGFLNATVGGGGLLQVPLLMLIFPQTPLPAILGTAKLAGVPGLAAAVAHYRTRIRPIWPLVLRISLAEIPLAILGARVAVILDPALARPIILFLLTAVSLHVLFQPRFGETAGRGPRRLTGWVPWTIGIVIGFYEGFFGTGSGTVLIILFVTFCGLDLVEASIAAAAVTLAGAAAALIYFIAHGAVLLPLGAYMALFNIAGALVGSRLVTMRGNTVIRRLLGVVLLVMIIKLTWDSFQ